MKINEQTILITGATGGIGKAIARRLHEQGARLFLVARRKDRLTQLQTELGDERHTVVAGDISTSAGRSSVVQACRKAGEPGVSVLINAAGINDFRMFSSQSDEAIRNLVEVNLTGPILLCHAMLPSLMRESGARIINIGSTFGSIGYPGFSAYCASKFGLRGFTEALRRELDGTGVRVSYIAPRATRTALNSNAVVEMNDALGNAMDDPERVAEAVLMSMTDVARSARYIGWPEKLFVRINALFPGLVDSSLRKQLPVIRRFAAQEN